MRQRRKPPLGAAAAHAADRGATRAVARAHRVARRAWQRARRLVAPSRYDVRRHLRLDDLPVLTAARTVVDVARARPIATSIAAIDAALQRGMTTPDEINEVLLRCWNWPGIRRAQRAVRLSDGPSESPLESVSRLVLDSLGLPKPDLQPVVLDQYGRPIGRLDFYWDEFGVAGEADGRGKYDSRDVLTAEKQRQELLEDCGLVFVRWDWAAVFARPHLLKARLEAAFARGRGRDRSGFPRLWSVVPTESVTSEENVISTGRGRQRARKR